jgi:translation initiation factor IF-2
LRDGTLKTGDIIATPTSFTKIKSLESFKKEFLEKAFPSDPIVVFGFNQVPKIGEEFKVFPDLESAENHTHQLPKEKIKENVEAVGDQRILNLVLKADVAGSLEAAEGVLSNILQDKVILNIVKSGVGNINESDLKTALGSRALVLGFRVKTDNIAKRISDRENIRIISFDVIYNLVEEVRKVMERIVAPEQVRTDLGKMKVLAKFLTDKNRQIIGGRVTEGELKKGSSLEVYRNEEKIGSGRMINLQRNKKEAESVSKGDECGILFEGDVKITEGDIILAYIEQKTRQL